MPVRQAADTMDDASEPPRLPMQESRNPAKHRPAEHARIPSVASLSRRRLRLYIAMLVGDIAILLNAFVLAGGLYRPAESFEPAVLQGNLLLPVYVTLALILGVYSQRTLTDTLQAIKLALLSLVISSALLNFILFFAKSNANFSRVAFAIAFALCLAGFVLLRLLVAVVVKRLREGRIANVLVIEDGGPGIVLPDADRLDALAYGLDPTLEDPFHRDRLGQAFRNRDRVVVSCPIHRRPAWALVLKAAGVQGEILSEPANAMGALGIERYEAQDRTALVVSTGPLGIRARAAKRAFDIGFALFALAVAAPVLVLAALAIKLTDGGPVVFVQRRLGLGNRIFPMFKLRTMRQEAGDGEGQVSTTPDDRRVTGVGRFLRRTSIEELPQLVNVLRGEMSIVGPRPHALGSQAGDKLFWEIDSEYWRRHAIRPGLTGLAQVRGLRGATEGESDLADRLQSDLEYIAHWSLFGDIGIVLRTLLVMVHPRAY
ncbi:MAG: sugar transferase [Qipengyuania sp.]